MKKRTLSILTALSLSCTLVVPAFAAERTIYLSGYTDAYSVEEVPAGESEMSITGDLEDYGRVTLNDMGSDPNPFTTPVYYSDGPVTITITGGIDEGEALDGTDADGGSWVKIPLTSAYVNAIEFDEVTRSYNLLQQDVQYFDGKFMYEKDDGTTGVMTIQEKNQKEQQDQWYYGYIYNGATVTLSEPGIYQVSTAYGAIEGVCMAYFWIGQRAPGDDGEETDSAFTDVANDAWYAKQVAWAVENGITGGTGENTFSPDRTCSTAEILTFLWRAAGSEEPTIANPFTDVAQDAYYLKPALWAYEKGLVSGTALNGDTACTRAATVTYLWKLAGAPKTQAPAFVDVAADADYAQAVQWAVENGVTGGISATTFGPAVTCTRSQIVTFLYADFAQ